MSQDTGQVTTPQTIPSGVAPAPERTDAPDGRRLGLTLGMLVLPMYGALGAPSVACRPSDAHSRCRSGPPDGSSLRGR